MDGTPAIAALEARLNRLERAYRRVSVLATTFAAVSVIAVLTGQSPAPSPGPAKPTIVGNPQGQHVEIGPGSIVMFDSSNKPRVRLSSNAEIELIASGATSTGVDISATARAGYVKLTSPSGAERGYFGTFSDNTVGLQIEDGGTTRATMSTFSSGSVGTLVYDANGKERLHDILGANGIPSLGLLGTDGKYLLEANGGSSGGFVRTLDTHGDERTYMGTYSNGTAGVAVEDSAAKERVRMFVGTNGIPGLGVLTPDGKFVVEANGGAEGGFVRAADPSGTERAYMGLYTDGSSGFSSYNTQRTKTWGAP